MAGYALGATWFGTARAGRSVSVGGRADRFPMPAVGAVPGPRGKGRSRAWLSGVRMRSALAAVAVVAVALTAGGGLLLLLLQRSLLGSVQDAAEGRAVAVSRLVGGEGITGLSSDLQTSGSVGQLVQVLGPRGVVVAASTNECTSPPAGLPRPQTGTRGTGWPSSLRPSR